MFASILVGLAVMVVVITIIKFVLVGLPGNGPETIRPTSAKQRKYRTALLGQIKAHDAEMWNAQKWLSRK